MKLILIRGLPGSGKSTLAQRFGCLHIETDMLSMINGAYAWDGAKMHYRHGRAQYLTEEILKLGVDIVVSNTFTQKSEMKEYIELANKYKATLLVFTMTSSYGNIHNVPTSSLDKMKNRWENYSSEILVATQDDITNAIKLYKGL